MSVTLLAAVTRLPQTPPPTDPGILEGFSSLTGVMLLLSFDQERWWERVPLATLSGVDGPEGGLMGVAGVTDMAGTLFDVCRDRAGLGPLRRSGERSGVRKLLDVPGNGGEMTMGTTSRRGRDWDLRRGGEAAGGFVTSLLEGERPL